MAVKGRFEASEVASRPKKNRCSSLMRPPTHQVMNYSLRSGRQCVAQWQTIFRRQRASCQPLSVLIIGMVAV